MASTKNTLWCFGDSFTIGNGCIDIDGKHYYSEYPERRVKRGIFPERIADHFGLELVNKGFAGSSNTMILESIIDNMSNIKKGDRVIIGMSDSARLETFVSLGGVEPTFTPPHGTTVEEQRWSRFPLTHYIASTDIKYWAPFTKQQASIVQKYIIEVILPIATYKEYHELQLVKKLTKALLSDYIYIWGANQWTEYEDIFTATKGKLEDYHFSWKGHKDFANKVIKEWNKSKYYVDKIERIS